MQSNIQNLNKGERMKKGNGNKLPDKIGTSNKRPLALSAPTITIQDSTEDLIGIYVKIANVNLAELYTIAQTNFKEYFKTPVGKRLLKDAFSKDPDTGLYSRICWLAEDVQALAGFERGREEVLVLSDIGITGNPGSLAMCINKKGNLFFALNICSHELEMWYVQPLQFIDYRVCTNGLVLAMISQLQTPESAAQFFKQLLAEVGE